MQYLLSSVYFTAKMLAATDQLELLCHQSNIQYCGMIWCNTKKKVTLSRTHCPAHGQVTVVMVRWYGYCVNGCRFDSHLADFFCFFFAFFQAPLRCFLYRLVLLG